jgi:ureidoglycolate lyase
MNVIALEPLTTVGFAPFGDVVDTAGAATLCVNQGFATRFDNLAKIDVADEGGSAKVSIFESKAVQRPVRLRVMERHPLGSQIFYPLQDKPWFVVVCLDPLQPGTYRAFLASGRQGINYRRNVWHHPLLASNDGSRFIVIDRLGAQPNLEEVDISSSHFSVNLMLRQRGSLVEKG